jgi:Na+/H+ antiporter NhaD/arsenite permease-like protein
MKTIWDLFWNKFTWPLKLVTIIVLVIVIGLVIGFFRSCGSKKASIDLETVNKINNANEQDRKAELRKTIEENADGR